MATHPKKNVPVTAVAGAASADADANLPINNSNSSDDHQGSSNIGSNDCCGHKEGRETTGSSTGPEGDVNHLHHDNDKSNNNHDVVNVDDERDTSFSEVGSGSAPSAATTAATGASTKIILGLDDQETRLVKRSKILLGFIVGIAASVGSIVTYRYTKYQEEQDFRVRVSFYCSY